MPGTTASPDMPEPSWRMSASGARVALESVPRSPLQPEYHSTPRPGFPPPSPRPPMSADGAEGAPMYEMPVSAKLDGVDGMDESEAGDDISVEGDFAARDRDDRATRPLFAPEQWVSDPDFWESKTHIALTGRRPVPRPKTVALKPPQRFRPAPRWRSLLVLFIVCLLIGFTLVGIVELAKFGRQALGPSHSTTTPVATHVVPTATPPHKK